MKRKLHRLNQRGAALIAGLLILVVLSILGITTMQSSLLQERMAGNMEQRDIAFEMAEAGLRHGEGWLTSSGIVVVPVFNNNSTGVHPDSVGLHNRPNTGLLKISGTRNQEPTSTIWSNFPDTWTPDGSGNPTNYKEYTPDDINADPTDPDYQLPRYYLEHLADVDVFGSDSLKFSAAPEDMPGMYRITSRGVSPNGRSVVILQSTFIR